MSIIERRSTPVSHDEARGILLRFCASHFGRGDKRARISNPADPNHDDDLLMDQYIDEQCVNDTRIAALAAENARLTRELAEATRRATVYKAECDAWRAWGDEAVEDNEKYPAVEAARKASDELEGQQ